MTSALTPAQEWWTAAEIAAGALPDLPGTRQGVALVIERAGWQRDPAHARRRAGKGGGWEYSWMLFPDRARRKLLAAAARDQAAPKKAAARPDRDEAWGWYDGLPQDVKDKAVARLRTIREVEALEAVQGAGRHAAVLDVARLSDIGARTIWTWFAMIEGVRSDDRLPYLAPRNRAVAERGRAKDCEPEFWEVIRDTYLRLAGPTFAQCYRAAVKIAQPKGWDMLPERTMRRRMDVLVSRPTQVLAREGVDALKRLYPPQVRDKSMLTAMEAVNLDFHKMDVFVEWPAAFGQNEPGTICRPQIVVFQDIYSGRILSWRVDQTPNSTAVQLAAGDMIEDWGIPRHVLMDNGRENAAKAITGGAATRYRFKVKADDIQGLFPALGCEIHWASPYHGQAKPIERAFRDFCTSIAKDVRFEGAYTGNTVMNKPADYGSHAVPLETFMRVFGEGVVEHNTRQNRRSPVAYNRSFAEVFDESYATAPIRKATEAQRRLWLLGAEGLRADTNNGCVWFQGNQFYDNWMQEIAGQRVIARFDPADFLSGLHIYAQDGAYLGHAPVRQAVGFFDQDEARMTARLRREFMNAEKAKLKALRKYDAAMLSRMMDEVAPAVEAPVEANVIKPHFGQAGRAASRPDVPREVTVAPDIAVRQAAMIAELDAYRPVALAAPAAPESEETMLFRRALDVEARAAAGEQVTVDEARWLERFQSTAFYRAQRGLYDEFGADMFG